MDGNLPSERLKRLNAHCRPEIGAAYADVDKIRNLPARRPLVRTVVQTACKIQSTVKFAADFGQYVPAFRINGIRTVGQAQSRMQRGSPFAAVNLRARPQIMYSPSKPCRICKVTEQLQRILPEPVFAVIEQHTI